MLLEHVELAGRREAWVVVDAGVIVAVGAGRPPPNPGAGTLRIDGRGGALLPGLHDHHLHLFATAARDASVWCGAPAVGSPADLVDRLRRAAVEDPGEGWVRAVGWDDDVVGWPDRHVLDEAVGGRPVRLQHRSGAMWVLNTAGLAALGLLDGREPPRGVELDPAGRPTGRLRGLDRWSAPRWRSDPPALDRLGATLAARGVTGVTDATAHNDEGDLTAIAAARRRGELRQRVTAMTAVPTHRWPAEVARGPVKVVLDEHAPESFEDLVGRMADARTHGTGVAVHTLERATTVLALRALDAAGGGAGDRLEHAAVLSDDLVGLVAEAGVTVVTQPHFMVERGTAYRRQVEPREHAWLYRCGSLRRAGVPLAAGSDAPVGGSDPWAIMGAAVAAPDVATRPRWAEQLDPEAALALFTGSADAPGTARRVAVGEPADLCVLDRPWRRARTDLSAVEVQATLVAGAVVWRAGADDGTPRNGPPRVGARSTGPSEAGAQRG